MWDEYHVSSKESIFKPRLENSNKEPFVVLLLNGYFENMGSPLLEAMGVPLVLFYENEHQKKD